MPPAAGWYLQPTQISFVEAYGRVQTRHHEVLRWAHGGDACGRAADRARELRETGLG